MSLSQESQDRFIRICPVHLRELGWREEARITPNDPSPLIYEFPSCMECGERVNWWVWDCLMGQVVRDREGDPLEGEIWGWRGAKL